MHPVTPIEFSTPDGVMLKGLWFGSISAQTVFIFIHGLGSNAFSNHDLIQRLVSKTTAVLAFNNRGHDTVSRIKKVDTTKESGYSSFLGGCAYEVFEECVDDIKGALLFVEQQKSPQKIFLIGHSTGSQKSVFFQHKTNSPKVSGLILLSPLSDYAGIMKTVPPEDLTNILSISRALISQGNPDTLLPQTIWPSLASAQRFISLATPDSIEEIFTYAQKNKPSILASISIPVHIFLGTHDEYADRPIQKIASWFQNVVGKECVSVINGADHGFSGFEQQLASDIVSWAHDIK